MKKRRNKAVLRCVPQQRAGFNSLCCCIYFILLLFQLQLLPFHPKYQEILLHPGYVHTNTFAFTMGECCFCSCFSFSLLGSRGSERKLGPKADSHTSISNSNLPYLIILNMYWLQTIPFMFFCSQPMLKKGHCHAAGCLVLNAQEVLVWVIPVYTAQPQTY